MNKQFQWTIILLVSIFGLISCKSDKNSQPIKNESVVNSGEINNVLFLQEDGSFKPINDNLNTLNPSSQLRFDFTSSNDKDQFLISDASCLSPVFQEKIEKQTIIQFNGNSHHVETYNLLPPKVFSYNNTEREIVCDFSISINQETQTLARINLTDITIVNLNSYSNWNIIENTDQSTFDFNKVYRTTELENITINFEEMSTITTLCEDENREAFYSESEEVLSLLFNEDLFTTKDIKRCRLVSINENNNDTHVSPLLKIQGKWPQLRLTTRNLISLDNALFSANSDLITYNISNQGTGDGTISFTSANATINVRPYYGNPLPEGKIGLFPKTTMNANWHLVNERRPLRQNEILRVSPGETITITLVSESGIQCPTGQNTNTTPNACFVKPLYLGAQIEIPDTNILSQEWDYEEDSLWTPLRDRYSRGGSTSVSFWHPNENLNNWCPSFPLVQTTPNTQGTRWFHQIPDCTIN